MSNEHQEEAEAKHEESDEEEQAPEASSSGRWFMLAAACTVAAAGAYIYVKRNKIQSLNEFVGQVRGGAQLLKHKLWQATTHLH